MVEESQNNMVEFTQISNSLKFKISKIQNTNAIQNFTFGHDIAIRNFWIKMLKQYIEQSCLEKILKV